MDNLDVKYNEMIELLEVQKQERIDNIWKVSIQEFNEICDKHTKEIYFLFN